MIAGARIREWPAIALGLGTVLVVTLLVEALVRAAIIDPYVVPLPSEVLAAFSRVIAEENVVARFLLTGGETLAACLLLAGIGVPLGVLFYYAKILRAACETWVAAMAAAPTVLMYPLFLVVFGRSSATIVAIGFVAALPAVILKTLEGLSATPQVLLNVGKSLKLSGAQNFAMILFPSALPSIFVGLRLGLVFALVNIVGVEFLINFGGLGQLVNELAERYDLPGMYAAIGFVILVSILVFFATERLESWLRRAR